MTIVFNDFTSAEAKHAEIFASLIGNVQSKVEVKVSELEADYHKELLKLEREQFKLEVHHREELSKLKDQDFNELFKLQDDLSKLKLRLYKETEKILQNQIQHVEESKELRSKAADLTQIVEIQREREKDLTRQRDQQQERLVGNRMDELGRACEYFCGMWSCTDVAAPIDPIFPLIPVMVED